MRLVEVGVEAPVVWIALVALVAVASVLLAVVANSVDVVSIVLDINSIEVVSVSRRVTTTVLSVTAGVSAVELYVILGVAVECVIPLVVSVDFSVLSVVTTFSDVSQLTLVLSCCVAAVVIVVVDDVDVTVLAVVLVVAAEVEVR